MTREEAMIQHELNKKEFAARSEEFERQAAHYKAISKAASDALQVAIDQMNAPWIAFAEEIRRMP